MEKEQKLLRDNLLFSEALSVDITTSLAREDRQEKRSWWRCLLPCCRVSLPQVRPEEEQILKFHFESQCLSLSVPPQTYPLPLKKPHNVQCKTSCFFCFFFDLNPFKSTLSSCALLSPHCDD